MKKFTFVFFFLFFISYACCALAGTATSFYPPPVAKNSQIQLNTSLVFTPATNYLAHCNATNINSLYLDASTLTIWVCTGVAQGVPYTSYTNPPAPGTMMVDGTGSLHIFENYTVGGVTSLYDHTMRDKCEYTWCSTNNPAIPCFPTSTPPNSVCPPGFNQIPLSNDNQSQGADQFAISSSTWINSFVCCTGGPGGSSFSTLTDTGTDTGVIGTDTSSGIGTATSSGTSTSTNTACFTDSTTCSVHGLEGEPCCSGVCTSVNNPLNADQGYCTPAGGTDTGTGSGSGTGSSSGIGTGSSSGSSSGSGTGSSSGSGTGSSSGSGTGSSNGSGTGSSSGSGTGSSSGSGTGSSSGSGTGSSSGSGTGSSSGSGTGSSSGSGTGSSSGSGTSTAGGGNTNTSGGVNTNTAGGVNTNTAGGVNTDTSGGVNTNTAGGVGTGPGGGTNTSTGTGTETSCELNGSTCSLASGPDNPCCSGACIPSPNPFNIPHDDEGYCSPCGPRLSNPQYPQCGSLANTTCPTGSNNTPPGTYCCNGNIPVGISCTCSMNANNECPSGSPICVMGPAPCGYVVGQGACCGIGTSSQNCSYNVDCIGCNSGSCNSAADCTCPLSVGNSAWTCANNACFQS